MATEIIREVATGTLDPRTTATIHLGQNGPTIEERTIDYMRGEARLLTDENLHSVMNICFKNGAKKVPVVQVFDPLSQRSYVLHKDDNLSDRLKELLRGRSVYLDVAILVFPREEVNKKIVQQIEIHAGEFHDGPHFLTNQATWLEIHPISEEDYIKMENERKEAQLHNQKKTEKTSALITERINKADSDLQKFIAVQRMQFANPDPMVEASIQTAINKKVEIIAQAAISAKFEVEMEDKLPVPTNSDAAIGTYQKLATDLDQLRLNSPLENDNDLSRFDFWKMDEKTLRGLRANERANIYRQLIKESDNALVSKLIQSLDNITSDKIKLNRTTFLPEEIALQSVCLDVAGTKTTVDIKVGPIKTGTQEIILPVPFADMAQKLSTITANYIPKENESPTDSISRLEETLAHFVDWFSYTSAKLSLELAQAKLYQLGVETDMFSDPSTQDKDLDQIRMIAKKGQVHNASTIKHLRVALRTSRAAAKRGTRHSEDEANLAELETLIGKPTDPFGSTELFRLEQEHEEAKRIYLLHLQPTQVDLDKAMKLALSTQVPETAIAFARLRFKKNESLLTSDISAINQIFENQKLPEDNKKRAHNYLQELLVQLLNKERKNKDLQKNSTDAFTFAILNNFNEAKRKLNLA